MVDGSGEKHRTGGESDVEPHNKLPYPLRQRPEYSREDFDVDVKNNNWLVLSPLDAHPASMDAKTAYEIARNAERIMRGSGQFTARQLLVPPFQIQDDLDPKADIEMFLRVLTRINNAN